MSERRRTSREPFEEQESVLTASTTDVNNNIGELKGLLIGIQHMMSAQNDSLNRRIDDMHHSNTRRLDDLTTSINHRIEKQQADLAAVKERADGAMHLATELKGTVDTLRGTSAKAGGASGAGAAALVAAGVEMIRAFLSH